MPFLFDSAKRAEGMEVRIAEAAIPEAALLKKDLLFMIIVLKCECLKFDLAEGISPHLLNSSKAIHC